MTNLDLKEQIEILKRNKQKTLIIESDRFGRPLLMLNYMTEAGKPEQHDFAGDVTTILEGEGVFKRGGTIEGKVARSVGEWRGDALVGAEEVKLQRNIVVMTGPGIPHQTEPRDYLVFLTLKNYVHDPQK